MKSIVKGRNMSLAPINQPGDTGLSSRTKYAVAKTGGMRATVNQGVRNGKPKFFDAPNNRTSVPTSGVSLTAGLRSD